MSQSESFPVDLLNRNDVRAKLPLARKIGSEKKDLATAAISDAEQWQSFVRLLEQRAELPAEAEAEAPGADGGIDVADDRMLVVDFTGVESVLEAVVRSVNEQNRPIRAKEVAELLRTSGKFEGITSQTVSNALYYASERADPRRIRKLTKRGFYAPLAERLPV